ncbi:MAG TPA: alpha-amylase/4-alpha-glucanotransferase domain-containing protein, partial [Candidatus Acidoferrales bacterium]|nr:alpha-amylase/4-alpha-glucanotransferase domain-containing protein [Candidatus Acidoferrales bacterium]
MQSSSHRHRAFPQFTAALAAFLCLLSASPAANPAPTNGVRIVTHATYPELQVDGKPFFINSAAFLYPRIPRSLWERSLERYRELGINTIDLSIPWNWHEPRERQYDFDGHTNPRRDLRALLRIIARYGFKLIVRPGPAINREWRNAAFPDWLVERPAAHTSLVDRLEGRALPAAADAGTDSDVSRWLETVAHELAPYSATATVRVPPDEPPSAKAPAADIEVPGPLLFVEVDSGANNGAGTDSDSPPRAPWNDAAALCAILARGGVSAPCFIHPLPPGDAASGSALPQPVAAMGEWFLRPASPTADEERRITPADAAQIEFTAASLATQPAFPPALIEFDAGWFAPQQDARPEPSPAENTRLSRYLFLAYGLRGLSWFPFQDTLTPAGFGTPAANRYYRWDAALALNGSRQARAAEALRMGEWLRQWGSQLAASHRRADFGLIDALPALHAALPAEKMGPAEAAGLTSTLMQLERLAQYAGMSSELVDPQNQPAEQLLRHALLLLPVFRPDDPVFVMSKKAQHALQEYVRVGGVLVCFPARPQGLVFMEKESSAPSAHLPPGALEWKVGAGRLIVLTKDFYSWISLHDDFAEGAKRFEAPFALSLLEAVLLDAGVPASVRRDASKPVAAGLLATEIVSNEGTSPLGDRSSGQGWLSVVNLSDDVTVDQKFQVLSPRASARSRRITADDWVGVSVILSPRESLLLPLDLSLCLEPHAGPCEDSVVTSGAELVRAEREGKTMILTFYAPAKAIARIRLASRPSHYEVDESHADAHWSVSLHELTVELMRGASPDFRRVVRIPLSYAPALPERPKAGGKHPSPARFFFFPAGAVRLPLGGDATLLTNPPLFVFRRGSEGSLWVIADNRGGESGEVQVRADGQFNTSAHGYVGGSEMRSLNLKFPASTVEAAAAQGPAADGLFHGALHFSAGPDSQDLPAAYAILPAKGAIGYTFDFDADGSEERTLENAALRAIFSPGEGGRMIALLEKSSDANLVSTMGLLEDAFSFTPNPPGTPPELARGRAGTFNRAYTANWIPAD